MRLLLIILAIYTSVYGNNSSSSSNRYNSYSGIPIEQTYQQRRIGYTTNYGYGVRSSVNNQYIYVTSPSNFYHKSSTTYNPGSTNTSNRPGPRKSKERPDPDNDWADWWRMNMPNLLGGNSNWPSYVDDDYWDWFLENYPEYEDEARKWFEDRGQKFPGDPDDPFLEPIGDFPVELLLLLIFYYYIYYQKKKTRKSQIINIE